MRVCTRGRAARRSCRRSTSSRRSSTIRTCYGQIAAANALSDVYAMGGEPRTALAIAALPKDGPGPDVIAGDLPRRLRQAARSRRRAARRPHRHRSGDQVRLRDHRRDRSGPHADERRRARGRRADPDQAARHRHHRDRAQVRPRDADGRSDAAVESMTRLNRDAADVVRELPAGVVSALHRRHRLRARRPRRRRSRRRAASRSSIDTDGAAAPRGRARAGGGQHSRRQPHERSALRPAAFGSARAVTRGDAPGRLRSADVRRACCWRSIRTPRRT